MRHQTTAAALLVLMNVLLVAIVPAARAMELPTDFSYLPVIVGVFEYPVGFTELPDGRFLILERNSGDVRLWVPGTTSTTSVAIVPDVSTGGERGLLGVAVDPGWPTRPYVYVYYTKTDATLRVDMLTATGDLTDPESANLTLGTPYALLAGIADMLAIHNGGTLRFGTDGMLYLSIGDDSFYCTAQSPNVLGGCLLRMDVSAMPGAGSGPPPRADITPPDNPFPGPNAQQLVWLQGVRNPFRFTIDPATNDLVIGDVGLSSFEEMDVVPYAAGGGLNLGWPQLEGFTDPGLGLTCGLGNTFTDPVYVYDHGPVAAVIGGPRYRVQGGPYSFPAEYDGSVFFTDFYQDWVRRLVQTPSGWELAAPVAGQSDSTDWGTSAPPIVDMQQGSDGAIYCIQLVSSGGLSGLYRIAYHPTTTAPPVTSADSGLARAVPNPAAADGTRISWTARRAGTHTVRISDVRGRIVRTARLDVTDPARAAWHWDGASSDGRALPAGAYFYVIDDAQGRRASGRLVLLR